MDVITNFPIVTDLSCWFKCCENKIEIIQYGKDVFERKSGSVDDVIYQKLMAQLKESHAEIERLRETGNLERRRNILLDTELQAALRAEVEKQYLGTKAELEKKLAEKDRKLEEREAYIREQQTQYFKALSDAKESQQLTLLTKIDSTITTYNDRMAIITGSNAKQGDFGEALIEHMLHNAFKRCPGFECNVVSKKFQQSDIRLIISNVNVMVEAKYHKNAIPKRDLDKFKSDLDANSTACIGWMIALTTTVAAHSDEIVRLPSGKILIITSCLTQKEDPIQYLANYYCIFNGLDTIEFESHLPDPRIQTVLDILQDFHKKVKVGQLSNARKRKRDQIERIADDKMLMEFHETILQIIQLLMAGFPKNTIELPKETDLEFKEDEAEKVQEDEEEDLQDLNFLFEKKTPARKARGPYKKRQINL